MKLIIASLLLGIFVSHAHPPSLVGSHSKSQAFYGPLPFGESDGLRPGIINTSFSSSNANSVIKLPFKRQEQLLKEIFIPPVEEQYPNVFGKNVIGGSYSESQSNSLKETNKFSGSTSQSNSYSKSGSSNECSKGFNCEIETVSSGSSSTAKGYLPCLESNCENSGSNIESGSQSMSGTNSGRSYSESISTSYAGSNTLSSSHSLSSSISKGDNINDCGDGFHCRNKVVASGCLEPNCANGGSKSESISYSSSGTDTSGTFSESISKSFGETNKFNKNHFASSAFSESGSNSECSDSLKCRSETFTGADSSTCVEPNCKSNSQSISETFSGIGDIRCNSPTCVAPAVKSSAFSESTSIKCNNANCKSESAFSKSASESYSQPEVTNCYGTNCKLSKPIYEGSFSESNSGTQSSGSSSHSRSVHKCTEPYCGFSEHANRLKYPVDKALECNGPNCKFEASLGESLQKFNFVSDCKSPPCELGIPTSGSSSGSISDNTALDCNGPNCGFLNPAKGNVQPYLDHFKYNYHQPLSGSKSLPQSLFDSKSIHCAGYNCDATDSTSATTAGTYSRSIANSCSGSNCKHVSSVSGSFSEGSAGGILPECSGQHCGLTGSSAGSFSINENIGCKGLHCNLGSKSFSSSKSVANDRASESSSFSGSFSGSGSSFNPRGQYIPQFHEIAHLLAFRK